MASTKDNKQQQQVYFYVNFNLQLAKLVPAISEGYSRRTREKKEIILEAI